MNIKRTTIEIEGPCNFCKRGKLATEKVGLDYPYEDVLVLSGTAISVAFCEDCFNGLKEEPFNL